MIDISTPYVKFQKKITKDGYKLICIPYAGGGASFYNCLLYTSCAAYDR